MREQLKAKVLVFCSLHSASSLSLLIVSLGAIAQVCPWVLWAAWALLVTIRLLFPGYEWTPCSLHRLDMALANKDFPYRSIHYTLLWAQYPTSVFPAILCILWGKGWFCFCSSLYSQGLDRVWLKHGTQCVCWMTKCGQGPFQALKRGDRLWQHAGVSPPVSWGRLSVRWAPGRTTSSLNALVRPGLGSSLYL